MVPQQMAKLEQITFHGKENLNLKPAKFLAKRSFAENRSAGKKISNVKVTEVMYQYLQT